MGKPFWPTFTTTLRLPSEWKFGAALPVAREAASDIEFRPGSLRLDKIPQRIWKQRGGHTRSRYLAEEDQVSEVLLHALRVFLPFSLSPV